MKSDDWWESGKSIKGALILCLLWSSKLGSALSEINQNTFDLEQMKHYKKIMHGFELIKMGKQGMERFKNLEILK